MVLYLAKLGGVGKWKMKKISKQLLSINDLLREIEISNVNSLKLVLEKTNCIREMIDELIDKKI